MLAAQFKECCILNRILGLRENLQCQAAGSVSTRTGNLFIIDSNLASFCSNNTWKTGLGTCGDFRPGVTRGLDDLRVAVKLYFVVVFEPGAG